jgi:hypothetical protein
MVKMLRGGILEIPGIYGPALAGVTAAEEFYPTPPIPFGGVI